MAYKRSTHRDDFESRIAFLIKKARRAQRFAARDSDIRDLVFQCAVFQTSAAIETYLRLLVESWLQNVKTRRLGSRIPQASRSYLALRRLDACFTSYIVDRDERLVFKAMNRNTDIWNVMIGIDDLPNSFSGRELHEKATYPSVKNIKKLFARIGIDNIIHVLNKALSRDVELMIENFQGVRTTIAHSSPIKLTIVDVETLLGEAKILVGAFDRALYRHVLAHGGAACWP